MEIDDFRDSLISKVKREAETFLKEGKYGGELSEAIDRLVENEGVIRVICKLLCGDDAKETRKALDEEMFSERFCEQEIERAESIARENYADAKRYEASNE